METFYVILKGLCVTYGVSSLLLMIFSRFRFELIGAILFLYKEKKNTDFRSKWGVLPQATVLDKYMFEETCFIVCRSFFENPSTLVEDQKIEVQIEVSFKTFNELRIGDKVFLKRKTTNHGVIRFEISESSLTKEELVASFV